MNTLMSQLGKRPRDTDNNDETVIKILNEIKQMKYSDVNILLY